MWVAPRAEQPQPNHVAARVHRRKVVLRHRNAAHATRAPCRHRLGGRHCHRVVVVGRRRRLRRRRVVVARRGLGPPRERDRLPKVKLGVPRRLAQLEPSRRREERAVELDPQPADAAAGVIGALVVVPHAQSAHARLATRQPHRQRVRPAVARLPRRKPHVRRVGRDARRVQQLVDGARVGAAARHRVQVGGRRAQVVEAQRQRQALLVEQLQRRQTVVVRVAPRPAHRAVQHAATRHLTADNRSGDRARRAVRRRRIMRSGTRARGARTRARGRGQVLQCTPEHVIVAGIGVGVGIVVEQAGAAFETTARLRRLHGSGRHVPEAVTEAKAKAIAQAEPIEETSRCAFGRGRASCACACARRLVLCGRRASGAGAGHRASEHGMQLLLDALLPRLRR